VFAPDDGMVLSSAYDSAKSQIEYFNTEASEHYSNGLTIKIKPCNVRCLRAACMDAHILLLSKASQQQHSPRTHSKSTRADRRIVPADTSITSWCSRNPQLQDMLLACQNTLTPCMNHRQHTTSYMDYMDLPANLPPFVASLT